MADIVVEAEVKSNIGQLNRDLEKTSNETVKVKDAFGAAGGAIRATQGAMKLLGTESTAVENAVLNVQTAMSLGQGLQSLIAQKKAITSILGLMGKWTGATKVLSVATKAFNVIMKANPVGAIVAGVTALIAAGTAMLTIFKDNKDQVKEIDTAFDDLGFKMDLINTKAAGMQIGFNDNKRIIEDTSKSEKERLDALAENTKNQLGLDEESLANLAEEQERLRVLIVDTKSWQASEKKRYKDGANNQEGVKMATDRLKKANEDYQKVLQDISGLQTQMHERAVGAEKAEGVIKSHNVNKEKADVQEVADRRKRAYEQRINAEKNLQKQIEKLEDQFLLNSIEDEEIRAKKSLEIKAENAREDIRNSKASQKFKDEALLALNNKYQQDLEILEQGFQDKKDKEKEDKEKAANEALTELKKENLIAQEESLAETELELELQRLERQKKAEDDQLKQHENYLELKGELDKKYTRLSAQLVDQDVANRKEADREIIGAAMDASSTLMKQASEFAGENKELAAGAAIIDTYAAVAGALREGKGTPLSYLMAASVALAGFKAVQSIYDTPVGDGGGGGSAPDAGTPAPQMQQGAFTLSGGQEPDPVKAFVVTDEMTNSQNQLANIRRRATI